MADKEVILKVDGISKAFPGVQALSSLTMDVHKGEILALVGENGAGKSTLIKILSGVYQADEGQIMINGEQVNFRSPIEAVEAGVSVVYQELSLVPNLTVAENMYGGRPPKGTLGLIDMATMRKKTNEMLADFEVDFDANTQVGSLFLGNQQLVEIIKATSVNSKILILDEPTSSLSLQEANVLFSLLNRLRDQNITIIYVSHHLEEVFSLSDRIAVLRDGEYVGTVNTKEANENQIVSMMVGRDLVDAGILSGDGQHGDELIRVEGFSRKGLFNNVGFTLFKGEILTFFGLVGAGRTEMAQSLIGLEESSGGKIYLRGKAVNIPNPGAAMALGMAYLSEDRKNEGLFLDKTIKENFLATNLHEVAKSGWLNWKVLEKITQKYVDKLEIRTPSLDQKLNNLSGGNQQKVLLGEWLATGPELLIVDEPTRGIDVGTKQDIHQLLRELATEGKAIMVISSDLPEALRISDRIAVMRKGELVKILPAAECTEESIMELAAGVVNGNHNKETN